MSRVLVIVQTMDPTLGWILGAGLVMVAIALVGSATLLLTERRQTKLRLPLVALAAGSMIGGALFHMLPESIDAFEAELTPYVLIAAGFVVFLILEQLLHWHHCHHIGCRHGESVGYLLLIADGLHSFVDGLLVGGAFVVDVGLGVSTWIATAAHEIPQELGDFAVLLHAGWPKGRALLVNVLAALPFLVGGICAYAASFRFEVDFLIPFAAGNFLYVGATDLVPEFRHRESSLEMLVQLAAFVIGLGLLLAIRLLFE